MASDEEMLADMVDTRGFINQVTKATTGFKPPIVPVAGRKDP